VNYDDSDNYVTNSYLHTLSMGNFLTAVSDSMDGKAVAVFEPAAVLFKMVLFSAFGASAGCVLITNIALHIANTVVVAFTGAAVAADLERNAGTTAKDTLTWHSFAAALLFGVHPLFVESVAWASCLPYLLCALLAQLCVYSHIQKNEQCASSGAGVLWWCAEVFLFGLACFSKTTAVSVAGFLIAMDFMGKIRTHKRTLLAQISVALLRNAVLLAVAVFAILCALQADSKGYTEGLVREIELEERFLRASHMPLFYFWKIAFPWSLAVRYPLPATHLGSCTMVVVCLLLNLIFGGLCCYFISRAILGYQAGKDSLERVGLGISTAWVGYLVLLAPTLGFVSTHVQCMAQDRYAYIPALIVGVSSCSATIKFIDERTPKNARFIWHLLLGAAVACLTTQTRMQLLVWRTSETLWTHASIVSPDDAMVLVNLGVTLNDLKRPKQALEHLQQAILLRPASHTAHGTAGIVLLDSGRVHESIAAHRLGLQLSPLHAERHYGLGVALKAAGSVTEAAHHYRTTVAISPGYSQAWNNLGSILQTNNKRAEAEFSYHKAIAVSPAYSDAYSNLGVLHHTGGQLQQAIKAYQNAIANAPTHANARTNLALALSAQSQSSTP
jgi:Flp pilus assembly protein TadD